MGCQISGGGGGGGGELLFVFLGSCCFLHLKILKLIPFFCMFSCRMARGQEETSTNQVGHRRGTTRETSSSSSLVAAMFVEELRSFCQVLADISLELSNGTAVSTVGGAYNAIYFTQEQFAAGIWWYEVLGSFGLPFDLNQSLTFLGLSQLDGAHSFF